MTHAADAAPRATVAAQGRVLRRLSLTLMFRGHAGASGKRRRLLAPAASFAMSLGLFSLLGVLAFTFWKLPLFAYAGSLHALTFLMVSTQFAATSGTVFFSTEEADVVLHRAIDARALLAAKVRVLVLVTLALAVALNLCGLIVPRLMLKLDTVPLASPPGWLAALPPAWFAALDVVLCGRSEGGLRVAGLAALAVGATALITWVGVGRLVGAYEQGLVMLNEAAPGAEKPGGKRGRWVAALLRLALLPTGFATRSSAPHFGSRSLAWVARAV